MTPISLMVPPLRVRRRTYKKRKRRRNIKLIKHKRIKPRDKLTRYKPLLCNFIDIPQDCFSAKWRLLKLQDYFSDKEFTKAYKLIEKIKNTPENRHTSLYFPKEAKELILEVYNRNIRLRWIVNKLIFIWKQNKIKKKN